MAIRDSQCGDRRIPGRHPRLGIVALLGALIAFRLPRKKIEPTGEGIEQIARDTTRNTTVPKLQLELDDLPASSEPSQA